MPRLLGSLPSPQVLLANLPMIEGSMGNWTPGVAAQVSFAAGKVGSALQLNGKAGSYISTPYSETFDLQAFSILTWIKVAAGVSGGYIYGRDKYIGGKDYGVDFGLHSSAGRPYIYLYKGDGSPGTYINVYPTGDLRDGLWHHLAVIYDGANLELFLDNVSKGTASWTATIGYYPETPVVIGAMSSYVTLFVGLIDEFYLFNRALSTAEIRRIYRLSDVRFWHRRQQSL